MYKGCSIIIYLYGEERAERESSFSIIIIVTRGYKCHQSLLKIIFVCVRFVAYKLQPVTQQQRDELIGGKRKSYCQVDLYCTMDIN